MTAYPRGMSIWGRRIDAALTPRRSSGREPLRVGVVPISAEQRAARMRSLTVDAARFGTVTPLGPFQLLLVQPGQRVNHILHLLLTLVTLGFWAIAWIVVAVDARPEERHILFVDEKGMIWMDNEPRPYGLGR